METHTDTHARPLWRFTHACAALTIGLILLASASHAQVGLSLKGTYIKTGEPVSVAEGQFPYAVDPLVFLCTGAKGSTCTVLITLETQWSNISDGAVAGAAVRINHSENDLVSPAIIGMDSTSHASLSNTRSFAWKAKVTKGIHLAEAFLLVSDASTEVSEAGSFTRTLTVNVYKP